MLKIKNPYPGFHNGIHRAYEVEEAELFYGRDQDISNLKLRLRQNRLVALLSTAHAGKTSFLRAGVMADFEKNLFNGINGPRWKSVYFTPDHDPVLSMARAIVNPKSFLSEKIKPSMEEDVFQKLSKNDYGLIRVTEEIVADQTYNLLMVVDDFSDLFSRKVDDKKRNQFINLIMKAVKSNDLGFYCIVSMNLDELSNRSLKDHEDFYKSIMRGNYQLRFLDQMGLKDAIEIPAKIEKSEVEEELSLQLIEELISDNDQLRKLQIYMSRTWFEWKKNHDSKYIETNHFMKATGQRQKTKLGSGGKGKSGIKIKTEDNSGAFNPLTSGNLATGSIEQDFELLDEYSKELLSRIIMVSVSKKENELIDTPRELDQLALILGIKSDELVKLINEVPSILNIDRKQVFVSNLEALKEWSKTEEFLEREEENIENYKLMADASILHYIDGIGIDSVFNKEQYEKIKIWYDDFMPTEEWSKLYHKQYELAIDFIGKLEETYGPVTSRPKPKPKPRPKFTQPSEEQSPSPEVRKPLKLKIKSEKSTIQEDELLRSESSTTVNITPISVEDKSEPEGIVDEEKGADENSVDEAPIIEKKVIKPITKKKISLQSNDEEDKPSIKKKIVIKKK